MTLGYTRSGSGSFGVQRSKVKVTRRINAHTVNAQYLPKRKAYEVQTWYTGGARRPVSATGALTSKVKGQGRKVTWRVWQVLADDRERNAPETPYWWEAYPPHGQQCLQVSRSKVKVTWSITIHNNISFRTTIAFYSHPLGGDTSTITLPPRFIVIRYSLGGDTDKSNTAWVRTLWVHSSFLFMFHSNSARYNTFRWLLSAYMIAYVTHIGCSNWGFCTPKKGYTQNFSCSLRSPGICTPPLNMRRRPWILSY